MIFFRIATRSDVPPFRQLVEQVRQALRMGVLQPGDQLPTVREVVSVVPVNPNTVFKAYRELERDGLIEGRRGLGTFVLRRPPGPPPETQAMLARTVRRWVASARRAGLDDESIESLVRATLHEAEGEGVA